VVKNVTISGLIILLVSSILFYGCGKNVNLPNAKDLSLSTWSDLYKLDHFLDEEPIPNDEFSQEYDPYPKYARSDYDSCYRRVFYTRYPTDIHKTSLELAPGYSLVNEVRVYKSVEKAKAGFADMGPPSFGSGIIGIAGTSWDISLIGDESKAWYHTEQILDDNREIMRKQIEATIYFRKGYVISSISVTTWGGSLSETAAFLIDLARVSEAKIFDVSLE
jgi:hypothetical protein